MLVVMGRSARVQPKNWGREEGMEWKDHPEQRELRKLVIVGWGERGKL